MLELLSLEMLLEIGWKGRKRDTSTDGETVQRLELQMGQQKECTKGQLLGLRKE